MFRLYFQKDGGRNGRTNETYEMGKSAEFGVTPMRETSVLEDESMQITAPPLEKVVLIAPRRKRQEAIHTISPLSRYIRDSDYEISVLRPLESNLQRSSPYLSFSSGSLPYSPFSRYGYAIRYKPSLNPVTPRDIPIIAVGRGVAQSTRCRGRKKSGRSGLDGRAGQNGRSGRTSKTLCYDVRC